MRNGHQKPTIVGRDPFTKTGEAIVKAGSKGVVVPDAATTHNMDRDFEVPYITFKLTALAEGAVCDPQPDVLDRLVKVKLMDMSRAQLVGESLPLQAVDRHSTFRWTPKEPLLMFRGAGLQITFEGRESFDIAFDGHRKRIDAIRVEVTLEGELLSYAYGVTDDAKPAVGVESPLG